MSRDRGWLVGGLAAGERRLFPSCRPATECTIAEALAPEPKLLQLCIRWQGSTTETVAVPLPPNRQQAIPYPETFVARSRATPAVPDDRNTPALPNPQRLTS